jgi:hypothetical protein
MIAGEHHAHASVWKKAEASLNNLDQTANAKADD